MKDTLKYGPRFIEALGYAAITHHAQYRKQQKGQPFDFDKAVPYVSHLLGVAAIVFEAGGGEDAAIAGLLHDAVEDQDVSLDELTRAFGPRVAHIVNSCSEHWDRSQPKPAWRPRKAAHLAHLEAESDREVLLVTAADKIHNGESILNDFAHEGSSVWQRFNASPVDIVWYYQEVSAVVAQVLGCESYAAKRLRVVAQRLEEAASLMLADSVGAETSAGVPAQSASTSSSSKSDVS